MNDSLFEYDLAKSAANLTKHGIDFEKAQKLWDEERLIVAPACREDEERWLAVGLIEARHWTAVVTFRVHAIRIISVRRSRKNEVENYEREND